jgi:uncharacterized protein (TIGR03437 family)
MRHGAKLPNVTDDRLTSRGEGAMDQSGIYGKLPTAPYPKPVQPVAVKIGGVESTYNFAGLVYAGVMQINARVPAAAASSLTAPLEVRIGGVATQPNVTVAIAD